MRSAHESNHRTRARARGEAEKINVNELERLRGAAASLLRQARLAERHLAGSSQEVRAVQVVAHLEASVRDLSAVCRAASGSRGLYGGPAVER